MTQPSGAQQVDATFAALADPTRRAIVAMLAQRPHRAGELAASFDVSAPAVSRHLKVLRQSGLVHDLPQPDDRRLRVYALRPEPIADLAHWLADVQQFWDGQLASFKLFAENHSRASDRPPQKPQD